MVWPRSGADNRAVAGADPGDALSNVEHLAAAAGVPGSTRARGVVNRTRLTSIR
jgi:hypothetical protein